MRQPTFEPRAVRDRVLLSTSPRRHRSVRITKVSDNLTKKNDIREKFIFATKVSSRNIENIGKLTNAGLVNALFRYKNDASSGFSETLFEILSKYTEFRAIDARF